MARRQLIYTDYYPYHIMARSNNKDWFYLEQKEVWNIFVRLLNDLSETHGLRVHAFVLMSNHYHLMATASKFDLGKVMQQLQQRVSTHINKRAGRINHVFGGPYKGSLISTPTHYKTVLKYVYRNPVEARLCLNVEDYKFSSLNSTDIRMSFPYNIDCLINYKNNVLIPWLNDSSTKNSRLEITKGLLKTEFKPVVQRTY